MSGKDKQKDLFLGGEGDAWFERNHAAAGRRDFNVDPIVQAVARCISSESKGAPEGCRCWRSVAARESGYLTSKGDIFWHATALNRPRKPSLWPKKRDSQ